MKVAVFTPYLPYPPDTGGKIRSYYLLRALTTRFDVDLYTVYHEVPPARADVEALMACCHRVKIFHLVKSWRTRDQIKRLLAPLPRSVDYFCTPGSLVQVRQHFLSGEYDLVVADELCMAPYAELALDLPKIITRQKVDHLHYWEMASARSWGLERILNYFEALKLRNYARVKMPSYQAYVACSERDVDVICRDIPGVPALVIANGADLSAFIPTGRQYVPTDPTLVYVGSMNYYPNIDAMKYFFEKIYNPIIQAVPDVRLQIVGHTPPPEIQRLDELPAVEVTGSVPDVRPYYDQATVFIVPLRLGGGTRLKIVEAMAMGVPVVSTSVGAEGLDVHPGDDILIADDAPSFVRSIRQLLADAGLREHIAQGGQRLAQRYDWQELTKPYPELVEAVIKQWRARE